MPENRLNSIEREFIDKPGSSFAIFQLKTGPEFHYLRFASLSELRRYAKQLRSEVHQAVNESEDILFHDKPEAEQYLKAAGFNVITDPDSHFITVRNPALQEAKIILAYGDGCCWMDGCDTRGVDLTVRKEHYELVYSAPLQDTGQKDASQILEDLYARFNLSRPGDFTGHSLSVSDVIILKQDDRVRSYYTDSFGFEELPDFFTADNPLRNAEMALEDDYGMIDGIINNGPKPEKEPKDLTALGNSDNKLPGRPRKSKSEPEL